MTGRWLVSVQQRQGHCDFQRTQISPSMSLSRRTDLWTRKEPGANSPGSFCSELRTTHYSISSYSVVRVSAGPAFCPATVLRTIV